MKVAMFLLSTVGTLVFIAALVFACLPSAMVTRLAKRIFNRPGRRT